MFKKKLTAFFGSKVLFIKSKIFGKRKKKGKINPFFDFSEINLFYLSGLSFLLISTSALLISGSVGKKQIGTKELSRHKSEAEIFAPIPIIKNKGSVTFPVLSAQAVLAVDLDSMVTLYEKNPDSPLLPASTTKIMTALVALDYYSEGDILVVDGNWVEGQTMGLVKGEKITVGSLLDGLLIYSANDAASVLAANYKGGEKGFVDAMNKKAAKLNLYNTHFENPIGFDGQRHFSTARDLVRIAIIAMKNNRFASRVREKEKIVTSIDGGVRHDLIATNELLGEVDGVLGVKTGWTEKARENLVTYLERGGKRLVIAVLGSQERFGETKELINWIFDNYEWKEVKTPNLSN